jgi:hypothetical protein
VPHAPRVTPRGYDSSRGQTPGNRLQTPPAHLVDRRRGPHLVRPSETERDAALAAVGIKVLRFTNQEALMATEAVALAILDEVERLDSIRPVPPRGTSRRRETL